MTDPDLSVRTDLTEHQRTSVLTLAKRAEQVDGVAALSEQSLLELRSPVREVRHLLLTSAEELVGYAQVDAEQPSAELLVDPVHRRQGWGRRLLDKVRATAPGVAVWAHGDLPAAQALAAAAGMASVRELWQMATELPAEMPGPARRLEDVTVRSFVVGQDEEAWVALNARAFASHPEQGRMTVADLRARQDEAWFDPDLLWFAVPSNVPDGAPLAAMWVKVLPGERSGEIYALGVDPDQQGRGLGGLLTDVAMRAMVQRGLREATLYVEGENTAAIRTYQSAGFQRSAIDVQYR